MPRIRVFHSLLFLLFIFNAVVWAQITTGGIRGTVTDTEDKPVPGATVTISSPALIGTSRTANTNELGVFRFPSLPVGTYTVEVSLEGFQTVRAEKVSVGLDSTANVPLTMNMATTKGENMTVVGETPLIDVTQSGLSTNYSKQILEEVPTQRNFYNLMQVAPGIAASTGDSQGTGDRTIAFGSNQQSNSWNVDGLETTAPETGSSWMSQAPDSIEEIQVIGVGAPAEYGSHTGAVFNVVTKKGGNDLHGGANYYFQGDALTGTNIDLSDVNGDAAHFNRKDYHDFSATVGGPIKKDRLWFFGSVQTLRDSSTDPGNPPEFATVQKQDSYDGKLTALMGKNEITGFYHFENWGSPDPASPFVTPSAVYQERGKNHGWGGGVTSTLTNNLLVEAHYSGWDTRDFHDSPTGSFDNPFIDYTPADGGPPLYSGGALYPFDYVTSRHQVNGKVTYYAENFLKTQHEFRFGVQFSRGNADTLTAAGVNGFYDYNYAGYSYRVYQQPFNYGAITHDIGTFLDDTVTVNDRLTLNLGVRFDHDTGSIPDYASLAVGTPSISPVGNFVDTGATIPGTSVMDWNTVSPRLGFVLQTQKNGKSVLQGSFGVYYDHNVSGNWDFPSPAVTPYQVFNFDPVTNTRGDLVSEVLPGAAAAFDPEANPPRTLQYALGYDYQITNSTAIGAQYVHKDTTDLIGWEINGGEWSPTPFTDPFTGNQYTLLNLVTNPILVKGNNIGDFCDHIVGGASASACAGRKDYFQKYDGLVLTFTKKFTNNWALDASYTYSKSTGLIPRVLSQVQFNPFYGSLEGSDPNTYVNANGLLQGDRPHMFRIQGVFFNLPAKLQASANLDLSSGHHFSRIIRAPLDQGQTSVIMDRDHRLPAIESLDLTIGRRFTMNKDFSIRVEGTIYNLLNADNELELATLTLAPGDSFVPDLWTKPRRLQLRIGMQF